MKKHYVLVLFVLSIIAGSIFASEVSAQRSADKQTGKSGARPAAIAAQSLFVDDFIYPAGSLLSANGWSVHSGTTNPQTVTSPGLTFTGYPSSGIGNAVTMMNTGEDVNKPFASQTSGTVYAAFMVNVSAATTTGDYFFHIAESPIGGNIFRGRVYVKIDGSNTVFIGISKAANNSVPANIAYPATGFAFGTTHLIVMKYTIVDGPMNDTVDLFIDPNLGGPEPAPSASAPDNLTATDPANVSLVALRQGGAASGATLQIDGIRIARTFADLNSVPPNRNVDFNGDGRSDYVVTRDEAALKTWYISTTGSADTLGVQWGVEFDREIPADYDGDGKTDIGIYREGSQGGGDPDRSYFYILQSLTGTLKLEQFGRDGDSPKVVGDYDGDGKADVAVFRETGTANDPCGVGQSVFYYRPSATPGVDFTGVCWGITGDKATGGDFDGDGKFDFCIFRIIGGSGVFFLKRSLDGGEEAIYWGIPNDFIAPGDYDGDGKYDFAVARLNGTNGEFYILERDGGMPAPIIVGDVTEEADQLANADYDGDGRTDIALWKSDPDPSQNFFVVRRSSDGIFIYFEWGQSGDDPVARWNGNEGN